MKGAAYSDKYMPAIEGAGKWGYCSRTTLYFSFRHLYLSFGIWAHWVAGTGR